MKFSTAYMNGFTPVTSNPHEAANFGNYDDEQPFFIDGCQVTPVAFFAKVQEAVQAAWDKKNVTHRRARVLHGSSVDCYVEKWVRR